MLNAAGRFDAPDPAAAAAPGAPAAEENPLAGWLKGLLARVVSGAIFFSTKYRIGPILKQVRARPLRAGSRADRKRPRARAIGRPRGSTGRPGSAPSQHIPARRRRRAAGVREPGPGGCGPDPVHPATRRGAPGAGRGRGGAGGAAAVWGRVSKRARNDGACMVGGQRRDGQPR